MIVSLEEVALWPCRANYARFRAACDDEVPQSFDQFEAIANQRLVHFPWEFERMIENVIAFERGIGMGEEKIGYRH